jgi:catechol 2,3-dioxygenase-like lactoylglutathione lyase family enzyme
LDSSCRERGRSRANGWTASWGSTASGQRSRSCRPRTATDELTKFHTPSTQGGNRHAPANTPGIRHIAFAVQDIDAVVAGLRARGAELVGELERYEDSYRLCYVRGPEGIIVELAEHIG